MWRSKTRRGGDLPKPCSWKAFQFRDREAAWPGREVLPEDGEAAQVKIGIETDRGPWVAALVASGYQAGTRQS